MPFSTRLFTIVFALTSFWIIYRIHAAASRDPTSVFFNPRTAYAPAYSTIRTHQAEDLIASANASEYSAPKAHSGTRKLCVGIPSIARKGARYLRDSVGSLLDGLTEQERADIFFTVFIPHSDPTVHPAYGEAWLPVLTDSVLTYDVPAEEMGHIKAMEEEGGLFREKGLYDYRYLLKYCTTQQTPYIAIFEDDIVAMDGWYHRTLAAIEEAEKLSAIRHASTEFLYLRLFYTEEFLGWNSEDWQTYLMCSLFFFSLPMGLLYYFRERNPTVNRFVTNRILASVGLLITILIALFFALGRVTVLPLSPGISLMPQYGCCSQAFVFPRSKALELATYFRDRRLGFPDVLIEDYANERGELRWAMTPSVVQHVGRKSSKVDDFGPASKHGMSVAEKIWSFNFENMDAEVLRKEHQGVAQRGGNT
ncbi:integral membrane protein-like protein [Trematosphaeria pertusa]|uniref:Integral membrane protein-like protein n=1 Tax=Trematosphaeria pertusa TaxID=390896 RepID=A0A6A6IN90_9PLEO|nr:integral membrane protein-like protein [Trematosphaeria pertusa]KAF2251558.1 integral membrane protein-like protein [Trematosphaeria pertusa]